MKTPNSKLRIYKTEKTERGDANMVIKIWLNDVGLYYQFTESVQAFTGKKIYIRKTRKKFKNHKCTQDMEIGVPEVSVYRNNISTIFHKSWFLTFRIYKIQCMYYLLH